MCLHSAEMEKNELKPHICKNCNERFVSKHYLLFHMTKAHPDILAFKCNICHKGFRLAINLEIHKSTCNPTESEESMLTATASKRTLQKSEDLTDKGERKQKGLDEVFKKPQSEFIALRERKELKYLPPGETITFTSEIIDGKTYERCSFCNKLLKKARKEHISRHYKIKPHICKYCGAGFTTKDSITRHLRTHTNERPFACKLCKEKFTCPQTLKFHTRAHKAIKLYQCEHCHEKFVRYCSMHTHIINNHVL